MYLMPPLHCQLILTQVLSCCFNALALGETISFSVLHSRKGQSIAMILRHKYSLNKYTNVFIFSGHKVGTEGKGSFGGNRVRVIKEKGCRLEENLLRQSEDKDTICKTGYTQLCKRGLTILWVTYCPPQKTREVESSHCMFFQVWITETWGHIRIQEGEWFGYLTKLT